MAAKKKTKPKTTKKLWKTKGGKWAKRQKNGTIAYFATKAAAEGRGKKSSAKSKLYAKSKSKAVEKRVGTIKGTKEQKAKFHNMKADFYTTLSRRAKKAGKDTSKLDHLTEQHSAKAKKLGSK